MNATLPNKGMSSILIICNEASTAPIWGYMIRVKKLRAVIQTDPQNAVQRCKEEDPAIVILDLHLSHAQILDLYRKLRDICENPILLFLPYYNENLIVEYYEAGVDDCVVKPISPVVFYGKVSAWLRHSKTQPVLAMDELRAGKAVLKPDQRRLIKPDGSTIKLTDIEVRLLHLMMSQPGKVFENTYIVNKVWGLYDEQDLTLLKHAVYRLRRKLEEDPKNPKWIQSWHGRGYNFNLD